MNNYPWINILNNGKYKFVKPLSINVCVAEDTESNQLVVIKKHRVGGPDGTPTYDDPQNEVDIHSKLDHPNIVKFIRWH